MWADPLLDLGRIGLDPAKDRRMVHVHAAVLQHQLEVTVADGEHEVPADRPEDHLGGELPPLEGLIRPHRGHSMPLCHAGDCTRSVWVPKLATEPHSICRTASPRLRSDRTISSGL